MSTQTPREIAFEDIRKGDRIRLEYVEDGIEFTREGVAHRNAYHGWFTSERGLLVEALESAATVTLLHRPVAAEPKGLGAVVRARARTSVRDRGAIRTAVRTAASRAPWADDFGYPWEWSDFDLDSIEVLSEGIEVES